MKYNWVLPAFSCVLLNAGLALPSLAERSSGVPATGPAGATKPEGSAEAKKPEESAEAKKPEGSAEAKKPEGSAEAKKPEGSAEATKPEGSGEAKNQKDSAGATKREGSAEAKKPEGSGEAKNQKDSARVYSPDRKLFAFVRSTGKTVDTGRGDASADVVFLGSAIDHKTKPLFTAGTEIDSHQPIGKVPLGDINSLAFSNDGKKLYFLTACYAVSDALICVNLQDGKLSYLTDANSLTAIRSGKRKGYLRITRHKYHPAPQYGSFEKIEYIKQ